MRSITSCKSVPKIYGTKLVCAHLNTGTMSMNISVLFICPMLFHDPKQIYGYVIQDPNVLHHAIICESVTS